LNVQRAKEIAESPNMISVTYNGEAIYIQNVDEKSGTAQVYPLNQPSKVQKVPVTNLLEH